MKIESVDIRLDKGNQVVELPKQFAIDDNKVYLKKTGNVISIIPYHNPWQNFHDSLALFTTDFMEDRGDTREQSRENFE